MVFGESHFCEVDDISDGVGQENRMKLRRNDLKRINNRRTIEKCLDRHFPDLGEIAKFHIKRRGDERKSQDEQKGEEDEKKKHENRRDARPKSLPNKKRGNDDEIHPENQSCVYR